MDFLVTGPKGNGKSLVAVGIMKEYLLKGKPIATNLNVDLCKLMEGTKFKETRAYRIPDHPERCDLDLIGRGNLTPNEDLNGALVIDELGTSMNSRNFQKKGRDEIIDYIIHSRKLGWDLYLIAQDISLIDKQIRECLEHVVYCRRVDRMGYPFFVKALTLGLISLIPLPKIHMAVCRYGKQPTSPHSWTKWYRGKDLYTAYDTLQVFSPNYPHTTYRMLPPYYIKGRYQIKYNPRNVMRITKIYLKRWSKPFILTMGLLMPLLSYAAFYKYNEVENVISNDRKHEQARTKKNEQITKIVEKLKTSFITSYAHYPDSVPVYSLAFGDKTINTMELVKIGFSYRPLSQCKLILKVAKHEQTITCTNPVSK